eukprot:4566333-Prymnesium_polylepis.1
MNGALAKNYRRAGRFWRLRGSRHASGGPVESTHRHSLFSPRWSQRQSNRSAPRRRPRGRASPRGPRQRSRRRPPRRGPALRSWAQPHDWPCR